MYIYTHIQWVWALGLWIIHDGFYTVALYTLLQCMTTYCVCLYMYTYFLCFYMHIQWVFLSLLVAWIKDSHQSWSNIQFWDPSCTGESQYAVSIGLSECVVEWVCGWVSVKETECHMHLRICIYMNYATVLCLGDWTRQPGSAPGPHASQQGRGSQVHDSPGPHHTRGSTTSQDPRCGCQGGRGIGGWYNWDTSLVWAGTRGEHIMYNIIENMQQRKMHVYICHCMYYTYTYTYCTYTCSSLRPW